MFSAGAVSLVVSWVAIMKLGVSGALIGMLAGEVMTLAGIAIMSVRESRRPVALNLSSMET